MSIKYSLLALLGERPRHGYDLKAEFDRRTGNTWPLNIGQVYTTLERLERDGYVTRGDEEDDGRVVYSLTAPGRELVTTWFREPVRDAAPPRDELAIKLALASTLPEVDVETLIQAQRSASMQRLQEYTRARRQSERELSWHLVIERLIFDTEAELRWLDHCEGAVLGAARRSRPAPAPSAKTATTTRKAKGAPA